MFRKASLSLLFVIILALTSQAMERVELPEDISLTQYAFDEEAKFIRRIGEYANLHREEQQQEWEAPQRSITSSSEGQEQANEESQDEFESQQLQSPNESAETIERQLNGMMQQYLRILLEFGQPLSQVNTQAIEGDLNTTLQMLRIELKCGQAQSCAGAIQRDLYETYEMLQILRIELGIGQPQSIERDLNEMSKELQSVLKEARGRNGKEVVIKVDHAIKKQRQRHHEPNELERHRLFQKHRTQNVQAERVSTKTCWASVKDCARSLLNLFRSHRDMHV